MNENYWVCRWVHFKILVVHKFSKLNLERDRAQSARRRDQFQAQLSRSRAS